MRDGPIDFDCPLPPMFDYPFGCRPSELILASPHMMEL